MLRLAVDRKRLSRLSTVLEEELGHALAFAVERGKIAANNGEAKTRIGMDFIEPGLSAPISFGSLDLALRDYRTALDQAIRETLAMSGLGPDQIGLHVAVRQGAGPKLGRGEMVMVQVAEQRRHRLGLRARQARTAEHQADALHCTTNGVMGDRVRRPVHESTALHWTVASTDARSRSAPCRERRVESGRRTPAFRAPIWRRTVRPVPRAASPHLLGRLRRRSSAARRLVGHAVGGDSRLALHGGGQAAAQRAGD